MKYQRGRPSVEGQLEILMRATFFRLFLHTFHIGCLSLQRLVNEIHHIDEVVQADERPREGNAS